MKRPNKHTLLFGLALLPIGLSSAAHADSAHLTLPKSEVIGTAENAQPEHLKRKLATSMQDIFRHNTEVSVGGGTTGAQRIYLNGVEGTNLNITLDGARQSRNLFQHRGGMPYVDPTLLKQVEVQSGAGGDNGAGALGGSIQMTTVDAQDLLRYNENIGARLRTGYQSASKAELGGLTAYALPTEKLGLLAHISAINRDDYRIGGGDRVKRSAGQERDYLFKLSLLDIDGHSLRFSANQHKDSGVYARGSNGSDAGYLPENPSGPSVPVRQVSERNTYTMEHHFQADNPLLNWKLNAYRNENEFKYPGSDAKPISTKENGFTAKNTATFALGSFEHTLTAGLDWFTETGRTQQLDNPNPALGLNGSSVNFTNKNLGVFINDRIEIDRLTLSLGLRFDDYKSDYGPLTLDGSDVSPNIFAQYQLHDNWAAFAGYKESVSASGTIPIGFLGRLNTKTKASTGSLKAESSTQKELGLSFNANNFIAANDSTHVTLKYYQTRLKDLIEIPGRGNAPALCIGPGASSMSPGNASLADCLAAGDTAKPIIIKGWALNAGWTLNTYTTQLNLAIADTEQDGRAIGTVRRSVASQGHRLVWDNQWQATETLGFGYTMTAVKRLTDVPKDEPERAGYMIHSLQSEWQPQAAPNLTLNLAVHNLFDKKYAEHTTLYSDTTGIVAEAGRDVRLSATYQF